MADVKIEETDEQLKGSGDCFISEQNSNISESKLTFIEIVFFRF